MTSFPVPPKRPYEITQHGMTRVDDYFWLRQREDPDVLKYLQAQMDYLEEVMGHTKPLQETLFSEMKDRIQETDATVPEKRGGYLYYERTEAGRQYPIFCRRRDAPESPEEILLDQNILAEGTTFCSISAFSVSPDGNKLAYSVDLAGDEVYTIYLKDLVTDTNYPEAIPFVYGSVYVRSGVEWANDSETIFYAGLDEAKRSYKFYQHKVGTETREDVLIYQEDDEVFSIYFSKTRDDAYILIDLHSTLTTEVRYLSASQPNDGLKILAPRRPGIEYYASHHTGTFFILTNENAKNFKLVKAPVTNPNSENWEEVIPHRAEVMLTGVDTFENYLVLFERKGATNQIRVSALDGTSHVRYVNFPEPTYYFELASNPDFNTNLLRFKYSSLITPTSVVDFHMDTGEWELKKENPVIGYDKSEYVCKLIYASAPDGTQIPISISYKKNLQLDGNNPTLLHGYGAYGAILDPEFTPNRISLLERGFVYAIGHIRGGSDLGTRLV